MAQYQWKLAQLEFGKIREKRQWKMAQFKWNLAQSKWNLAQLQWNLAQFILFNKWRRINEIWHILELLTFGSIPDFRDFKSKLVIFEQMLPKKSFTKSLDLVIDFSRSGTCLSSCLASSIYCSITKTCLFLGYNFLFVSSFSVVYPLQPISRPCSIEKYSSSRMANRYTRIFDAGGL